MKCMFQVYLSYSISMPEEGIKTLVVLFSEKRGVREGVESGCRMPPVSARGISLSRTRRHFCVRPTTRIECGMGDVF
jgi:hypothetical protein